MHTQGLHGLIYLRTRDTAELTSQVNRRGEVPVDLSIDNSIPPVHVPFAPGFMILTGSLQVGVGHSFRPDNESAIVTNLFLPSASALSIALFVEEVEVVTQFWKGGSRGNRDMFRRRIKEFISAAKEINLEVYQMQDAEWHVVVAHMVRVVNVPILQTLSALDLDLILVLRHSVHRVCILIFRLVLFTLHFQTFQANDFRSVACSGRDSHSETITN